MAFGEFDLIDNYFTHRWPQRDDVVLGVGDDGAVLALPQGAELVVATDTMVSGVHFDEQTPARAIAHKVAAVNLSDLAAMGAEPAWLSLALTLPEADQDWLNGFSHGLKEICDYYGCQLIGGDTTKGPLTVTVTAHGFVPAGTALRRDGAKPGDWLFVSGCIGDAGLALAVQQQRTTISDAHYRRVLERLYFPSPRVALGQNLREIASSAIDISDGLVADLKHILKASNVGARVDVDELPLSLAMTESVAADAAIDYALSSGDDYELCFTVPESRRGVFDTVLAHHPAKPICIGRITNEANTLTLLRNDEPWFSQREREGYDHFS
ncbi:Thiamine-monophosphate kinase [Pseudidiomarina piscicola]|uniref:Thiamine-monophosphate kinase n=1 Tax=Pseudidiomarina piscicola TaxID=2614830 RepID=A0A776EHW0_9GAMM|nr:thiamine-phosphate kinase [Pseudidiomarina piscicola]CAB0151576.1 Thiamine-monophosphate kinase [Pseudidiomarina piscicola]VZT41041.1 Thiamine-monophosphate kinase [Pseudomonas aeruginosa]